MKPQFKIKRFNELSLTELYKTLQLRSEVFVVEQDCVYQDIDGKDEKALHVLGVYDGEIAAYSRLFAPGDYFDNASIGRVVIGEKFRDRKWGHDLIAAGIVAIAENYKTSAITISAQLYLKKFYETHGFVQDGEQYLEDGIPHIRMNRK
ncbi:GNAT family acetyltransferase [Flavobacterium psychrophilum]|nr:GNAT family acetyltransferase [Flavobacterium psychrophilum]AOE52865.1 GNAT family acetyltransferase [Flavobacterium psychrophilum]